MCYHPDGEVSEDVPCGLSNKPSYCCPCGQTCRDNGVCEDSDNLLLRATCTEKNWTADRCPVRFCTNKKNNDGVIARDSRKVLFCSPNEVLDSKTADNYEFCCSNLSANCVCSDGKAKPKDYDPQEGRPGLPTDKVNAPSCQQ